MVIFRELEESNCEFSRRKKKNLSRTRNTAPQFYRTSGDNLRVL